MKRSRFALLLVVGLSLTPGVRAADAVGPALDRPALAVRHPERAVLLAGTQSGSHWIVVGERGIVLRSDDGAKSWQQSPVPVSVTLTAVRFADERTAFAVGHGGTVLTTADAGRTWTRRLDGRQIAAQLLANAQARHDAAADQATKAAEQLVADGPDKPLLDVLLMGPGRALVVGAYGLALATEDGGKTWISWADRMDNPKSLHLYAVRQRGARIVIAGEQGLVLKSDDAGHSFRRVTTPYNGSFFALELPGTNEIVLAGLRGNIWHSANGGADWTQWPAPMPVSIVATQLAADGTLLFANQAGFVLARRAGHLEPVNREPLPPLAGLVSSADGSMLALSVQGVLPVVAKP